MAKLINLDIEKELYQRSQKAGSPYYDRYMNLKRELLENEYLFTMHRFPGGNDHGPEHIRRVLKYLSDLLGKRRQQLSEMELYLLLCGVLLHDQGMLHGRSGHARVSQQLLKLEQFSWVFDEQESRYIGKLVAVHSASQRIEEEFKGYEESETLFGQPIRPLYLAALLRFADELDEDARRAKKRIRDKIALPEESVIYWLINLSIEGVKPDPETDTVTVTAHYENNALTELYPYEGKRVNAPAAVFRKMQKLNRERQYCMRFMQDGLNYRRVLLRFRSEESAALQITLDEGSDGEEFFRSHPDLFRDESQAAPAVVTIPTRPIPTPPVPPLPHREWKDLLPIEQEVARSKRKEFVADALELVGRPDLYGPWVLRVEGLPEAGQLTLSGLLFTSARADPLQLEIFALGPYPLNPPQIQTIPQQQTLADVDLQLRLKSLCPQALWNERYRTLKEGRLIHVADAIVDLQDWPAWFRYHASNLNQETGHHWRLEPGNPEQPRLVRSWNQDGGECLLRVIPSKGYPIKGPSVVCSPVPARPEWLGTGELNWQRFAANDPSLPSDPLARWRGMLSESNPLEALARFLDELWLGGRPN